MAKLRSLDISRRATQRQRGAVIIMTAGFMLLGVLCLALVIDTGRLYMEKRNLQRIADIAAIETASRKSCYLEDRSGTIKKWRQEDAQVSATRNDFSGVVTANCGTVVGGNVRGFSINEADGTAVRVRVSQSVPASLVVGGLFVNPVDLSAVAVAIKGGNPLAGLTIRSTAATVNTEKSALLNAVLGGLLGTNLNVSAVGYNGLIESKVNTRALIDALATELNITAGGTEAVLTTQLTVGQILNASIAAIGRLGGDLFVGTAPNITNILSTLNIFALTNNPTTIMLGDLIDIQTTTEQTAATIETSLFDLVQGSIQLASAGSVANVNLPVNLFGLAKSSIKIKVIEPPRLSAIGDPSEINPQLGANDPNAIFVRTAQIRSLINVDLTGAVGVTSSLLSAVSSAASPLSSFLSSNLSITGLISGVSDLLGGLLSICNNDCSAGEKKIIVARGGAIQIGLDIGGAKAYVNDYSCGSNKSLAAQPMTELAHIYIGKINEAELFSATKNPVVTFAPAPLIELGYKEARPQRCTLILCSGTQWKQANGSWKTANGNNGAEEDAPITIIAGLGVKADATLGGSDNESALRYDTPPDLGSPPAYQSLSSQDIVGRLSQTIRGLEVKVYSESGGLLGGVLMSSFGLLNGLLSALEPALDTLGSLLDPLVNALLNTLGVNIAEADVGANLTCGSSEGVRLVN
ncbi:MAG: pilus assembly protein TadG-related protein [Paraperlucidibaca sp.]